MWILYAVFAMLCFAGMQLLFKQLTRVGLSSPLILLYVFGIGAVICLAHLAATRTSLSVGARALGLLTAAAAFSYAGNFYMVRAIDQAPNPGYAMAVVGLQSLVVTVAAFILFGSELSWDKGLGVALSVLGIGLLTLDL